MPSTSSGIARVSLHSLCNLINNLLYFFDKIAYNISIPVMLAWVATAELAETILNFASRLTIYDEIPANHFYQARRLYVLYVPLYGNRCRMEGWE